MVSLSPQELVDCMEEFGYFPGSILDVFANIRYEGITSKDRYLFSSFRSGQCLTEKRKPFYIDIENIHRLTHGDEENLKKAVAVIGPIAAKIYVTENFMTYSSGIFSDKSCLHTRVTNHAVLVMGYGTEPSGADFWILKYSWGPFWGRMDI